jgi:hypothetical protein
MKRIIEFLEMRFREGYIREGSVFKVDYTGEKWTLGFWLRPCNYNHEKEEYDLRGICFRVRSESFEGAVDELLKQATFRIGLNETK